MWWPALGGIVVGAVGYIAPTTLGVGYTNITAVVSGQLGLAALAALCLLKLVSWSIALGSGTSGGTLAPLFTIGGALGGVIGIALVAVAPWLHVDPRLAALVSMAAIFAGASRAFLTSVVFAFETTQQPHALLPLLGACAAAYLVSGLMMRNTIMTEKIVRRGVRVPSEYTADYLDQVLVRDACARNVITLQADQRLSDVRTWLAIDKKETRHQGFPVLGKDERLIGVITRRDLLDVARSGDTLIGELVRRPPLVVKESHSLREAADHMVEADVGRLVVVQADDPHHVTGIITRGDLLAAHAQRLREARQTSRHLGNKTVR
jgi:CBS domain-containing protein